MSQEKLFETIQEKYNEWLKSQEGQTDGYVYEKSFLDFAQEFNKALYEHSLGENKAKETVKIDTQLGAIKAPKGHAIAGGQSKISPYLQERMLYLGQLLTFSDASECISKILSIDVNPKRIERLCHYYGALLENETAPASEINVKKEELPIQNGIHYCMVDGSMVLTREEKWKEIKLGRIFTSASCMSLCDTRNMIRSSDYTVHLGDCAAFFEKLAPKVAALEKVVWISDGATWIWNWVETHCPGAVQILDYFHCKERLCTFAVEVFKDRAKEREVWIKEQETLLFQNKVEQVIENMAHAPDMPSKASTITYFQNNKHRMLYGSYREKDYMISSGPIESANKNIIQKRLKLPGQRWTKAGAQQIANLRACYHSNQWNKVVNYIISQ